MRIPLLLSAVLALLLVAIGPAMGQEASSVTTNPDPQLPFVLSVTGSTIPSTLVPGNNGFIKLTISNYGTIHIGSVYISYDPVESPIRIGSIPYEGSSKDVTITENHMGPIMIIPDLAYNVTYLGGVPAQGSIERIFRISVPPKTPSGIYAIRFMVYTSGVRVTERTIVKYVLVTVNEPQPLKIETSSMSSFRAGERSVMNITLSNEGTSILRNLELTWQSPGDEILPIGTDNRIRVKSLYPGAPQDTPVRVYLSPNISVGLHPIHITTTYYDASGMVQTVNSTLGIAVGGTSPAKLSIDSIQPASFRAGERSNAEITISNAGSELLRDIVLSWETPNKEILPLSSDNRVNIPSIEPYQKVKVPLSLAVSPIVAPGIVPLLIRVAYFDVSDTQHVDNMTVGVAIGGTTDFAVSLQDQSTQSSGVAGLQSAGNRVSLSIANIGVNPAASLMVKIPKQATFTTTGTSEASLGNLNPGDFTVAQFQIVPAASQRPSNVTEAGRGLRSARTEGDLIVEISYTDTDGNRNTVEKKVSLSLRQDDPTTTSRRGIGSQFQGLLMYSALGVVGVTLLWTARRRKERLLSLGGLLKSKIIARLPKRGSR
ncbi:MAG: hypothetical protein HY555_02160 [Euryarchaeota archaeon]|nr:hypothetical protein [Euryarchaeota archaeon]